MSNQNTRVLCRQLARDLTPEELDNTHGGVPFTVPNPDPDPTTTFCTVHPHRDGDDDW
ncbi:MAG TPA: hypothetical protein VI685_17655 [Candidatus Angelobacter sp.]